MSLRAFHIFFITLSILLSAGFAAWCFVGTLEQTSFLATLGVISGLSALALLIYFPWFLRKSRGLPS